MKCRSVACVWPATPPSLHRVTAAAALDQPPTLYTGGADGSIVWWNISGSEANPEIKPVAMLCGHAASIADLAICYPSAVLRDGKTESSSCGALLSACKDGVMCVWSRGSGHCRRRRQLPPWAGSPSNLCTLPSNRRYVCVGCSFVDASHWVEHRAVGSTQEVELSLDSEAHHKRPPKCTVVIVDTYTLTIVQTIFHGNLSTGLPRYMTLFSSSEHGEKYSAVLVNSYGGMQQVPISKDSHPDGESRGGLPRNGSEPKIIDCTNGFMEDGVVLSCATTGNIIALLLSNRCIFRVVDTAVTIGEVPLTGDLCPQGINGQLHRAVGCMFLENGYHEILPGQSDRMCTVNFIIWNVEGSATLYLVSYSDNLFNCRPLSSVTAASHPERLRLSVCFIQLKNYLLRIESVCFGLKELFQWKPHITIWSLSRNHDRSKHFQQCEFVGEGVSCFDLISESSLLHETKDCDGLEQGDTLNSEYANGRHAGGNSPSLNDRIVSSSMVVSGNSCAPYAVVYGYCNGDIEIVQFDLVHVPGYHSESSSLEVNSDVCRRHFRGHTSAVLCLAAHQMAGNAKGLDFCKVLVSGSKDCTVRIWDLDNGNLITVMHHHVAPVRQIILPPNKTEHPWCDCFLTVGEDACVALASLETLRVERIFPGHPCYPDRVVWDGVRGYVACLCRNYLGTSDTSDVLYIWDIKSGARERILRGVASHSMFDHFCKGNSMKSVSGSVRDGSTSVSSLLLPIAEDIGFSKLHMESSEKGFSSSGAMATSIKRIESFSHKALISKESSTESFQASSSIVQSIKHSIKCSCPFPGVATLCFDLTSLMLLPQGDELCGSQIRKADSPLKRNNVAGFADNGAGPNTSNSPVESNCIRSLEESIVRFSLSVLHSWGVDSGLDQLLITDMKLIRPENFIIAPGLPGDKGSFTVTFPGTSAVLELWKLSSEFCAMRSLTMVSLAQRMVSLCHSCSVASSTLAAFYTRNFAEKVPETKPPSLQLLVSFWQDDSEHVRMAARSLFHCAASRAIPLPLSSQEVTNHIKFVSSMAGKNEDEHENPEEKTVSDRADIEEQETQEILQVEESNIMIWLESYEVQDWISCVGGTGQDAMTSHIIVAAALAVWYPSLVKPSLATLVVHHLVKLVMAMNEKYSSTAAELLAEGMADIWKVCIGSEIPRLIGDIFFQIECVSSTSASPAIPSKIRETLIEILLPSLAMADIHGFLNAIESQIWSTASDSPVHLVSLTTLIRVVRGAPKNLAQFLDKAINFIIQTMDPGNSIMRKTCLQTSMTTLKEVVRVFPMVALNDNLTRLAVGDAIGEISNASIRVYDMQSVMKFKVLDASAPLGLPSFLAGSSGTALTTVISALSFSPDGEGLVAFSEHGLMIRWWSLGSVWWEKLSRNYVPVHCTKLIFVPPWEGFSPKTAQRSVMASILGPGGQSSPQEKLDCAGEDSLNILIHNLDLSYRLEWAGERKVLLTRHGHELGTFPL
ncbi:uncharacterized protein LOC115675382 isoform X1 [Syzygium oleosum]|uniref:uncharacterized protein LOC115675382 isoform X1 n=1 Tax=Syzygium oleosum TaxID=219896 RepID=UPI0024B8D29A|nr:uncharacterized protein LOC115675382 isoform X1 [Syzygium oleosum]